MTEPMNSHTFSTDDEDVQTEDVLELLAGVLDNSTVHVNFDPDFIRDVALEMRNLRKLASEQ
jgi:hypothetical protein